MIAALDHIQMAMPAGQEHIARQFWCTTLGLQEIAKPQPLRDRGGLWLQLTPAIELHLGVEADFVPARKAHPGFRVLDIQSVAAALTQAGWPLAWDTALIGRQRFFSQDPFGNRLEFLQDTDSTPEDTP